MKKIRTYPKNLLEEVTGNMISFLGLNINFSQRNGICNHQEWLCNLLLNKNNIMRSDLHTLIT